MLLLYSVLPFHSGPRWCLLRQKTYTSLLEIGPYVFLLYTAKIFPYLHLSIGCAHIFLVRAPWTRLVPLESIYKVDFFCSHNQDLIFNGARSGVIGILRFVLYQVLNNSRTVIVIQLYSEKCTGRYLQISIFVIELKHNIIFFVNSIER